MIFAFLSYFIWRIFNKKAEQRKQIKPLKKLLSDKGKNQISEWRNKNTLKSSQSESSDSINNLKSPKNSKNSKKSKNTNHSNLLNPSKKLLPQKISFKMPNQNNIQSSSSNNQGTINQLDTSNGNIDTWGNELGIGAARWKRLREKWITQTVEPRKRSEEDIVDVDTVVEYLINPKQPNFPQPIPLQDLVDILLELWEAEYGFD